ncbi:eh domain protein [Grosmannia clavigera kw1407]|uniref:Eh domain protein n=1 Tax=Grosmannia clavigera (strain kw1407 / UAMH 11150) TaxID=655863 RepID=F0XBY6_GROCL|nr:eh domain protein [Grosmannia clavigera kw1407]EFX04550.1 eh domain protein [Grosmannia clavigera kw1407]
MSKVMRSVKNVTKGYSSSQVKVREATSNDPWGPTGTQMSEIAQLTFSSSVDFSDIMDIIDKRLNDKGKNWRHVLKALKVLDYCLHEGSEMVVSWSKHNLYIIRTLREFIYVDEEGRDVGQNVRIAAKELTALIQDDERLRAERSDRRVWKSRVTGLDEYGPQHNDPPPHRRHRERRQNDDEDDTEYKLAIEASKQQEEEDRRKRESHSADGGGDDDLAKAIKLSKEEEDRRRREIEAANNSNNNADLLFDPEPAQPAAQPQFTGFNQGYQQGSAVDFFANPIDQNQMQMQPTGYNMYAQYAQPTGVQNGYGANGFVAQPTGFDPYNQALQLQQQQTNNPWATSNNTAAQPLQPLPTGSNNPFAANPTPARAQPFRSFSPLSSLPEQKSLSQFQQQPQQQPQQQSYAQPPAHPQRELTEHEARLNALLATGEGLDTFGNTGQLRIPAQHTAPGTFVNSAGAGLSRMTADATGTNPFLRGQYTGIPTVSYGSGMSGNPYGIQPQQHQQQQVPPQGDLIQF